MLIHAVTFLQTLLRENVHLEQLEDFELILEGIVSFKASVVMVSIVERKLYPKIQSWPWDVRPNSSVQIFEAVTRKLKKSSEKILISSICQILLVKLIKYLTLVSPKDGP